MGISVGWFKHMLRIGQSIKCQKQGIYDYISKHLTSVEVVSLS